MNSTEEGVCSKDCSPSRAFPLRYTRKDRAYAGHPLAAHPEGAAWSYYAGWPLAIGLSWWRYIVLVDRGTFILAGTAALAHAAPPKTIAAD